MTITADRDYVLQGDLVRLFVSTDKSSKKAQAVIFYEHVNGKLGNHEVGMYERESKVMKEVRARYKSGRGRTGEPSKFYQYFLTKFRREINREREKVKQEKYGYKLGIG